MTFDEWLEGSMQYKEVAYGGYNDARDIRALLERLWDYRGIEIKNLRTEAKRWKALYARKCSEEK